MGLPAFIERERASSRIVADTLAGQRPSNADVLIFLRGGAAYWGDEHDTISWGVHLPSLDAEEVQHNGLRATIADEWGVARWKFGSIPVEAVNGDRVYAITMFNGFYGDTLREFCVSVAQFIERAPARGWLLSDDSEKQGGLMKFSDTELAEIRASKWELSAPVE